MYQNVALTKPVYLNMVSTIFLLLGMALFLYAKYFKNNKQKFKWGMLVLGIGLLLYIAMLQTAYMLVFSTEEMIGHNGLDRYLPTFFLSIVYFIVASTLKEAKESVKKQNLFYAILTFSLLCVTPLEYVTNNTITSGIYEIQKQAEWEVVKQEVEYIKEEKEISKIWLFGSTQNGGDLLYQNAIRYDLFPEIKARSINCYRQKEIEKAVQELKQEEISYVYIWSKDKTLEEYLQTDLEEKTLYKKVKQENGNFLWEKIK